MVHSFDPSRKLTGNDWLALLLEPPASAHTPGTPEWEAVAARHGDFMAAVGDRTAGERLDPAGDLGVALDQGRDRGHVRALPRADGRLRVEHDDAHLGPHRDLHDAVCPVDRNDPGLVA